MDAKKNTKTILREYIRKLIDESEFGAELYEGEKINIPDDLAIWCMDYYTVQNKGLYDFKKIPQNIITASKKLIDNYSDGFIYRGFGIEKNEIIKDTIFQPANGISWSFDALTAAEFSKKYEKSLIAQIDYKKLKYVVSMDVIMDNITQKQVEMLDNERTKKEINLGYVSESEVLVFNTFIVPKENIDVVAKGVELFKESDEDYKSGHDAPNKEDAPMHDLSGTYLEDIYSRDAARLYGYGSGYEDSLCISIMQSARNRPNMPVKIYRSVPNINKEVESKLKLLTDIVFYHSKWGFFPLKNQIVYALEDKYKDLQYNDGQKQVLVDLNNQIDELIKQKQKPLGINNGDWITISREYAKQHGEGNLKNDFKIVSKVVKASQLYTDGNSIFEWGYNVGDMKGEKALNEIEHLNENTSDDLENAFKEAKDYVVDKYINHNGLSNYINQAHAVEFVTETYTKLKEIVKHPMIMVYRVVGIEKGEKIDKYFGKHYTMNKDLVYSDDFLESIGVIGYQGDVKDELHLLTIETDATNIDLRKTLFQNIEYPFEEEIILRDTNNVKLKDIELMDFDKINEGVTKINNSNNYKEIEFVCHNSYYKDSTNKESQKALYQDLKELQIESDYGIIPYMQNFSDDLHDEISLAVVITDKNNENVLEKQIFDLAHKHNVEFDLYKERTDKQVDGLVRGDLYDNIINESKNYRSVLREYIRNIIDEVAKDYEIVYRGQPVEFKTDSPSRSIWVTPYKEFAKEYGIIKSYKMPYSLNILDVDDFSEWEELVWEFDGGDPDEQPEYTDEDDEHKYNPTDEFIAFLESKGYDGFRNEDNILVFDKSKLK